MLQGSEFTSQVEGETERIQGGRSYRVGKNVALVKGSINGKSLPYICKEVTHPQAVAQIPSSLVWLNMRVHPSLGSCEGPDVCGEL